MPQRRTPNRSWLVLALTWSATVFACRSDVVVVEPAPHVQHPPERLTQGSVDKIDLLFAIDNSGSMADKQAALQASVPNLIAAFVNPRCLDANGKLTPDPSAEGCGVTQPCGPLDPCPVPGTKREIDPILDIHVGVVTSSLGGHGSDSCLGDKVPSENDKGHLIHRSAADGSLPDVPTWSNKGFLVWDANPAVPTHQPPGESSAPGFAGRLAAIVGGAGEAGCGFENQLESWYRFAVDPDPYDSIAIDPKSGQAVLNGTDEVLQQQRADFLRPDSLFAIIMLSDENDCSVRDGGQYFFAVQRYKPGTTSPYHPPKPRAACATNPSSPCCRSCAQAPGDGCDDKQDGCIDATGKVVTVPPDQDPINLRCFDQKRRFGIDFLNPTQRYVDGLTRPLIPDRYGNMVPNPLFSDLNPSDHHGAIRDPSLVMLAGIVGVPWQDIARKNAGPDGKLGTADDKPDLVNGVNGLDYGEADGTKPPSGGFQTAFELVHNKVWEVVLGGGDPGMFESRDPRTGTNPITGDALSPPVNQTGPNPINGHEWKNSAKQDLQYACIFDLPKPVDCASLPPGANCDCKDPMNADLKPLCDPAKPTVQVRAKAYPSLRELEVLKALGEQGITASICPVQLDPAKAAAKDYGYNPAVGAIVDRFKRRFGGRCLARSLTTHADGRVDCFVLEARTLASADSCAAACGPPRAPLAASDVHVIAAKADPFYATLKWNCFCSVAQALGPPGKSGKPTDLEACQTQELEPVLNEAGKPVDGWCYVDATAVPPLGNPEIVAACPSSEKRLLRFVGKASPASGATTFLWCQ
jgi:hypothetical protein